MKFKFYVLLSALLMFGSIASKAQANGREEAMVFCQGLQFNSSVDDCMRVVQSAHYFAVPAIGICSTVSFDSQKIICMRAIAGKDYLNGEISICGNRTFDSQKIDCLKASGIPYAPPVCSIDLNMVRQQLRVSLSELRRGNYRAADQQIMNLIYYFDRVSP